MNIQRIWKEVKSFKKNSDSDTFSNLICKLGYKELAYTTIFNKNGVIIRRKFLVLAPSQQMEHIVLGKNMTILSITSVSV